MIDCRALGKLRGLWLLVATLCWVVPANAAGITLQDSVGHQSIHAFLDILEDPQGSLSLDDVLRGTAAARFRREGQDYFSQGFTNSAYWYRFTLQNPYSQSRTRILALDVAWLDSAVLYVPDAAGQYEAIEMGDELPFRQRTIRHHHFLTKLIIPPGDTTYLMRVQTSDPFMMPVTLRTPLDYDESEWLEGVYYGAFYGALLVMFLYNSIIFLSIRDKRYFFYCLYLAAFFLMNSSYNGFAYQYLWPEQSRWVNWSYGLFITLFQITGMWFALSFLNPRKRMPRIYSWMKKFLLVLILLLSFSYLVDNRLLYNMVPIYAVFIYSPLVALAGIVALFTGFRAARFFVLASLATLVGAFFSALTVSGFLPYRFITFHAVEFGLLADMVLLSLAMADRINLLRTEREVAQQRAIDKEHMAHRLLRHAKDNLELTVAQRTEELVAAKEQAEKLARVDALTGVANRRSFKELAAAEFTRARRHGHPLAVIVFDLDHFKAINDNFGHQAGDQVIVHAAILAKNAVREIDTVGRVGGEEFTILLPETDVSQAAAIAERLREQMERSLISDDGREISFTASFGISRLDDADAAIESVLRRADVALYAAKEGGRNRAVVWRRDLDASEDS
jgi:diguanylate cyclase (GGDEF)-like protein